MTHQMAGFNASVVTDCIGIPKHYRAISVMAVGYESGIGANSKESSPRKPIADIASFDGWMWED